MPTIMLRRMDSKMKMSLMIETESRELRDFRIMHQLLPYAILMHVLLNSAVIVYL
jgi:hypothetical protein